MLRAYCPNINTVDKLLERRKAKEQGIVFTELAEGGNILRTRQKHKSTYNILKAVSQKSGDN